MGGIFDLADPKDLLAKLGRELDRLRADPDDVDHAFNFFTTAEHMLDWLYPGNAGDSQRKHLRSSEPILATVSHLASGAKHFDKLSSHHKSVHGTKREGGFCAKGFWASGSWAKGFWAEPRLTISLSGAAANDLGATITALALAEKVYAYWSVPGRVS
jgi:hypothetical protein